MKYPRTWHLPWSKGLGSDDKIIEDMSVLETVDVVITEKLDGENTNMMATTIHARSENSGDHESRHAVKALWGGLKWMIPAGIQLCGENVYAMHSIRYSCLEGFFYLFGVISHERECLAWNDVHCFATNLGLPLAPVLHIGKLADFDFEALEAGQVRSRVGGEVIEGVVVRAFDTFPVTAFGTHVAKWVRAGHVQTDEHWMHRPVVPNHLAKL